jgi:hypothetical protein
VLIDGAGKSVTKSWQLRFQKVSCLQRPSGFVYFTSVMLRDGDPESLWRLARSLDNLELRIHVSHRKRTKA